MCRFRLSVGVREHPGGGLLFSRFYDGTLCLVRNFDFGFQVFAWCRTHRVRG